ncbi:MAG: hydrogenase maturation nickel metallochaperone HypA [Firmicutes bacterium]|nr:hydrogenase maturation nickel metallochaperone HypA [Bacillota bacterium]
MHGLAWMKEVLGEIEAAYVRFDLKTITQVTLRRGQLSHHPQEELESAWTMLREGTICQDAILVIEEEPAQIQCHACGWKAQWYPDLLCCQACGGKVELVSGTDLQLAGIKGT